jgi:hypothetical protein
MADGLILEFEGFGVEKYKQAKAALGVDFDTGEGAPEGQTFHCGAAKEGGWVVFEIWRSKADQERFMQERLGKALQESGVTEPPSRMEWLDVASYYKFD